MKERIFGASHDSDDREMGMNKTPKRISEHGQFIVLLAIMMVALLGVLAFVLDGGNLYFKRRVAQNAADAGALAGARALCRTKDAGEAKFMAEQYAEVHNGPTVSQVDVSEELVMVKTQISFDTFFAHVIGLPQLTAEATAVAECFRPTSGSKLLPVAWACRPPIIGGNSTSEDCQEQAITLDQLQTYRENPPPPGEIYPELYIVMDSSSTPDDLAEICQSVGGWLDCDMDGDGEDDLQANGDRAWLDLDGGGGGAVDLSEWSKSGYPGKIEEHTWFGGQPGTAASVYQTVAEHVGEIYGIPVFDAMCDDYPDPKCSSKVHGRDTIVSTAGGNYYYHVVAFAGFYVSCVDSAGVPGPECPGHKVARNLGVIDAHDKTIEGYFLIGSLPDLGGGDPGSGLDVGTYILKLIR